MTGGVDAVEDTRQLDLLYRKATGADVTGQLPLTVVFARLASFAIVPILLLPAVKWLFNIRMLFPFCKWDRLKINDGLLVLPVTVVGVVGLE